MNHLDLKDLIAIADKLDDYLSENYMVQSPRDAAFVSMQMAELIEPLITQRETDARHEDTKRLAGIGRIIKRYNIVGFVKLYNEALKRDWQDIRVPIMRNAELYSGDNLAVLTQPKEIRK